MEEDKLVRYEQPKSITELSVSDVKLNIDRTKSYDDQVEDVVGAMATARAVADENVAKEITERKAEELKFKSSTRSKQAEKENLAAEIEKQSAERELYEGVLQTFGITKHLPQWLMTIMVFVLSPIYILLTLLIGVPFGTVKMVIDNADNVLCRYDKVDANIKPHLKVTVWVLLAIAFIGAVAFVALKVLDKI